MYGLGLYSTITCYSGLGPKLAHRPKSVEAQSTAAIPGHKGTTVQQPISVSSQKNDQSFVPFIHRADGPDQSNSTARDPTCGTR